MDNKEWTKTGELWFSQLRTEPEIKARYMSLVLEYHLKGRPEAEEINRQYHAALAGAHGTTVEDRTYRYSEAQEEAVVQKIRAVLEAKRSGLQCEKIMLVGKWIWLAGTQREQRERLNSKGLGFRWHAGKGMWYWREHGYYNAGKGKGRFSSMAAKYGYREINSDADLRGV